jgi:hypothetical protein
VRDKLYFVGFLLGAGMLLFLGRHLLQGSVLIAWGLTFGGTTLAAVFGVILYRLQLQLKASRHELARKEVELKIALEVQRALFPRKLPNGRGLRFSAVCIPSAGISGDYYDVLQLPDGRLVFAIADISGKGISAAILMSNLQALLRVLVNTEREPGEICRRLNLHFHEVTDSSKYATFFFAEWRPCDGRLRYVNAGHNAPLMFAKDKSFRLEQGECHWACFPRHSSLRVKFTWFPETRWFCTPMASPKRDLKRARNLESSDSKPSSESIALSQLTKSSAAYWRMCGNGPATPSMTT